MIKSPVQSSLTVLEKDCLQGYDFGRSFHLLGRKVTHCFSVTIATKSYYFNGDWAKRAEPIQTMICQLRNTKRFTWVQGLNNAAHRIWSRHELWQKKSSACCTRHENFPRWSAAIYSLGLEPFLNFRVLDLSRFAYNFENLGVRKKKIYTALTCFLYFLSVSIDFMQFHKIS